MNPTLALLLVLAAPDPALVDLRAGVSAFAGGRYAEALRHLQRFEPNAVRLGEQALTWWHIGRALEALDRPCDALPWIVKTAGVRDAPTAQAQAKIADLKTRTFASLRVQCVTPGIVVRLKGVPGALDCPGEWTALTPGHYTVIARVGGRDFPPVEATARRCQRARVQIEMAGSLQVDSRTPGAEIWLDGERLGPAPQGVPAMPAGDYEIEIRAPGHVAATYTVEVPPGGVFEHRAALVPVVEVPDSAPKQQGAWLSVFGSAVAVGAGGILLYQHFAAPEGSEVKRALGFGLLAGGAALAGLATWLFVRDDDSDDETALMLTPGGAIWRARF